jgi:8-oxo-dGTP pyrophosphatase MutT (NUDIX family)
MKVSAGIIIVDNACETKRLLCVRVYSYWGFPKGHVEKNETIVEAAIRETEEETTLQNGIDYELTGQVLSPITYGSGSRKKKVVLLVANRTSEKEPYLPINPKLGKPENDEWRWIPIDRIEKYLKSEHFEDVLTFIYENIQ